MYKVGIIGFGVVGKSVLSFLRDKKIHQACRQQDSLPAKLVMQCQHIAVWDKRVLDSNELELLGASSAVFVDGSSLDLAVFIQSNDFVVASPGIDLGPYQMFAHKIVTELDFFSAFFCKPVLAITGSAGKTTITKLLGSLANLVAINTPCNSEGGTDGGVSCRVAMGGNVGIGMLDLISKQDEIDVAIIELSSFQLEFNAHFTPIVAIYTNVYPNHLDRHKTLDGYWQAKASMIRLEQSPRVIIASHDLLQGQASSLIIDDLVKTRSRIIVTTDQPANLVDVSLPTFDALYMHDTQVILATYHDGICTKKHVLIEHIMLPTITFVANWLQVVAGLYALGFAIEQLPAMLLKAQSEKLLPEFAHRVRHCATVRGVDFYDDSKSTIAQATLAAANRLALLQRPIIIIVGGLGKGIDRSWLMDAFANIPQIKKVFCFGPESHQFVGAEACATLADVVSAVASSMTPGDIVLFSPSGTSFDFFKNYEHRGQVFEQLVQKLA